MRSLLGILILSFVWLLGCSNQNQGSAVKMPPTVIGRFALEEEVVSVTLQKIDHTATAFHLRKGNAWSRSAASAQGKLIGHETHFVSYLGPSTRRLTPAFIAHNISDPSQLRVELYASGFEAQADLEQFKLQLENAVGKIYWEP